MVGDMKSPVDVTYLADTVILLRYFEAFGQVRRAISMLKKRTGCARKYHPRIHHRPQRDHRWADTRKIPRRTARSAAIHRCARADDGRVGRLNTVFDTNSERVLILAPQGRDAVVAAGICVRVVLIAEICNDLLGFEKQIAEGAGVAVANR